MGLNSLGYYGGKSPVHGAGRWIASLLPTDRHVTYVEPYAGMLGVLLARPRVTNEQVNDLNGRIINWWEVVRDQPKEFGDALFNTPYSEEIFDRYRVSMDEGSPLERALKWHVTVAICISHADGSPSGFGAAFGPRRRQPHSLHAFADMVPLLSERIRNVVFFNRPAIELLRRLEDQEDALIYCDPPYHTADTSPYAVVQLDRDETVESLRKQKGRVAISGYGDEWDELGWDRHEFSTNRQTLVGKGVSQSTERTEVLWTNYRVLQERLL